MTAPNPTPRSRLLREGERVHSFGAGAPIARSKVTLETAALPDASLEDSDNVFPLEVSPDETGDRPAADWTGVEAGAAGRSAGKGRWRG